MLESPTLQKTGPNSYAASYGSDKNLYVEFSQEARLNEFRTQEEGKPVYDDIDMITIMTAGSKTTFKNKVKMEDDANGPSDPHRFPAQWAAYKDQKEQIPNGLPLSEWPGVTKAHALNLRGSKIFTVEQLAGIPDQDLNSLGLGGRDLREKAKSYLARSVDVGEISRLIARIDALEIDNKALKEKLAEKSEKESPRVSKLNIKESANA